MTIDEVQARVAEIAATAAAGKDDDAHTAEDALYCDVLWWVAKTAPEHIAEVARTALTTGALGFSRWTS